MRTTNFAKATSLLVLFLGAASVAGACSTKIGEPRGSETNWYATCATDDDCGVGQCVCGACTTSCDDASACSGELEHCAAKGTAAFGAMCGTSTAAPGVCLKGCADGAACPTGTACVGSACVPTRTPSSGDDRDGGQTVPGSHLTTTYDTFTDSIALNATVPDSGEQPPTGRCLPRALPVNAQGHVTCSIIEAKQTSCDCAADGLAPVDAATLADVVSRLRDMGGCDDPLTPGSPACSDFCACELKQYSGADLDTCLTAPELSNPGWCYVDPVAGWGSATLTENCPAAEQRLLRFKSADRFAATENFIRCSSAEQHPASSPPSSPGAIGDPCIPDDENRTNFSGFTSTQVDVETGFPGCQSNVCLVSHFNGRVTCPYGQPGIASKDPSIASQADPNIPAEDKCWLPGHAKDGSDPSAWITVPVPGQLMARPPESAVYCSCRCAGDGPGPFCACPNGFSCEPLVTDYGIEGVDNVAGSYCTRNGTSFKPADADGIPCNDVTHGPRSAGGCGDP